MNNLRFSVSLRAFGVSIDPIEISKSLGIKPKWGHKTGDPRVTPKGVHLGGVYKTGYCSFRLIQKPDEHIHEMLQRFSDQFLKDKNLFHRIRDGGGRVEFFIGWFSTGNTGQILSHELLARLGDLRIDLALDIYGGDEPESYSKHEQCSAD